MTAPDYVLSPGNDAGDATVVGDAPWAFGYFTDMEVADRRPELRRFAEDGPAAEVRNFAAQLEAALSIARVLLRTCTRHVLLPWW